MYTTQDIVKKYMGINWDSGLDSFIDILIEDVQDYIEEFCGDERFGKRVFEKPTSDVDIDRYFDGNNQIKLAIGDLRTITTLTVDDVALVENEDYFMYPLNAVEMNEPLRWIELSQPETRLNSNSRIGNASPYIFDLGQRTIKITGKWGYSDEASNAIRLAATKLVSGVIKENVGDNDVKELKSETLGDYKADFQTLDKIANALNFKELLKRFIRSEISIDSGVIKVE